MMTAPSLTHPTSAARLSRSGFPVLTLWAVLALLAVALLSGCSGSVRSTAGYAAPNIESQITRKKEATRSFAKARRAAKAAKRDYEKLEKQIARDERRLASKKFSKKSKARAEKRLAVNRPKLRQAKRTMRRTERAARRAGRVETVAERRLERAKRRKSQAEQANKRRADRARDAEQARKKRLANGPIREGSEVGSYMSGFFGSGKSIRTSVSDYGARLDGAFQIAAIPVDKVAPNLLRQQVRYATRHKPGTVVVDTGAKYLYVVQRGGTAMRYGIGVGRQGFAWSGEAHVGFKRKWPKWTPPVEMIERQPELAKYCADCGGMPGGPANPLGARALYLVSGGKDTLYRLHGTPKWNSIGTAASSGCIRLMNQDVIDLYNRVRTGSKVVVI